MTNKYMVYGCDDHLHIQTLKMIQDQLFHCITYFHLVNDKEKKPTPTAAV